MNKLIIKTLVVSALYVGAGSSAEEKDESRKFAGAFTRFIRRSEAQTAAYKQMVQDACEEAKKRPRPKINLDQNPLTQNKKRIYTNKESDEIYAFFMKYPELLGQGIDDNECIDGYIKYPERVRNGLKDDHLHSTN